VAEGVETFGVPFSELAVKLGHRMVKNLVALGALQGATHLFPRKTFAAAIREGLRSKGEMVVVNEEAFNRGLCVFEESYQQRPVLG